MTQAFLCLWVISAGLIIAERRTVRIIIYLGVFSLITSICSFMLAAPDVAMAEGVVSIFVTICFIVCLEKYYDLGTDASDSAPSKHTTSTMIRGAVFPLLFTVGLFVLVVASMPKSVAVTELKERYLALFQTDIGGENAVTSIYLGYRVFDTLFEALMLLVSVVAVAHLSWYQSAADGRREHINSKVALPIIRIIAPLMILVGVYIIVNGHMTPGGGFQGGVVIAAFFICRYLVFDIYDIKVSRFIAVEKLVFVTVVILAAIFIIYGANEFFILPQNAYLIIMNSLIGMKVACGFIIILYRYIAFERR